MATNALAQSPTGSTTVKVRNVHHRDYAVGADRIGALIDGLATTEDRLWPLEKWPPMRFDKPLQVGARGGHGPIRYFVSGYAPGRSIRFTFTAPRGFNGFHAFEVESLGAASSRLTHRLEMRASRWAILSWTLVYRPLHDALIEDALSKAEASLGLPVTPVPWSVWVRWLRGRLAKRRSTAKPRATG